MPTAAEKNQFRRLVGDYGKDDVVDSEITSYLNDSTYELTADFVDTNDLSEPVTTFDDLVIQFHPEVIYYAAIQYLWNRLAKLADRHTRTVGQASENASEKFDRVYKMIDLLETKYISMQTLGADVMIGNLSRWSKQQLYRIGGAREEDVLD